MGCPMARVRSKRWGALVGWLVATPAFANGLPWEIWESPARLAMLDAGDIVLERSSHCLDGCRYDRSNRGPEDPVENPYPQRWLYRDGDEVVLLDERGPGAVTRFWVTTGFGVSTCIDPAIRVRFYVDGAVAPALDVPLAALFDGSTPPFTPPLVADNSQASGGYVSYVPIAHAASLRIALANADNGGTNPCTGNDERLLWFQIQHHRLAPGAGVTSFAAGQDFPAWRAFLAHVGYDPWNGMLSPETASTTLSPGETIELSSHGGAGWLRGIRLQLPREDYGAVRLRLVFDGATAVDAPLADFFAMPSDALLAPRGVLAGEDAGGALYAWLPMPYRASASVALVADASLSAPVAVDSALSFDAAAVPPEAAPFAAVLADACAPAGDLSLYSDAGAGKIVGMSARYHTNGAANLGYLEGDERAYVDDATTPAWYGTGVEDFHNGGFYFDLGEYTSALSGASGIDPDGGGATSAYRWLLADPLVYSGGARFTLEAGFAPSQPVPTCARSMAYAYRLPQRAVVGYDEFEVGDASAAAHDYLAPAGAVCAPSGGTFEDEPPTSRSATVCAFTNGSSHFRFDVEDAVPPLRLRRTFDVSAGVPGEIAGAPAAEIRVNGVVAGHFPPAIGNPLRRWQQQDALLDPAIGAGALDIEIVSEFTPFSPRFAESRWALSGGWRDGIFAGDFEDAAAVAAN